MPVPNRLLKTREVLKATAITHQVLYRYVTMGLVVDLETRETGHRLFPPETIGVIKLIQQLNQSGYTLRDIKDIFFKENRLEPIRRRWAKAEGQTAPGGKPGGRSATRRTSSGAKN